MLIGTPEELKARQELWAFLIRNTTATDIPMEVWVDGLDRLKVYVTQYMFPNITLRTFLEEEMFKYVPIDRMTIQEKLLKEQMYFEFMYFEFIEGGDRNIIWGLTRRGEWIVGNADMKGLDIKSLTLQYASSKEVIEAVTAFYRNNTAGRSAAMVADLLKRFISKDLNEKLGKLNNLSRAFGSVETFCGIILVKSQNSTA